MPAASILSGLTVFNLSVAFWGSISNINVISGIIPSVAIVLINSKLLNPLNRLWFKFGMLLGAIIAPVVMGIVFFLVVTPIGLIMKILGKDLLGKKFKKNSKSYWIKRDKSAGTMKQQF